MSKAKALLLPVVSIFVQLRAGTVIVASPLCRGYDVVICAARGAVGVYTAWSLIRCAGRRERFRMR